MFWFFPPPPQPNEVSKLELLFFTYVGIMAIVKTARIEDRRPGGRKTILLVKKTNPFV